MASFPGQPEYDGARKIKPVWILMKQEMMWAVAPSGPYANHLHCTLLQTDNHASTSSLNFYRSDTACYTKPLSIVNITTITIIHSSNGSCNVSKQYNAAESHTQTDLLKHTVYIKSVTKKRISEAIWKYRGSVLMSSVWKRIPGRWSSWESTLLKHRAQQW